MNSVAIATIIGVIYCVISMFLMVCFLGSFEDSDQTDRGNEDWNG